MFKFTSVLTVTLLQMRFIYSDKLYLASSLRLQG